MVPFSAGGVTDALARLLGQELQVTLGQPFIVVNKPGAAGVIACDFVKKAPADGYTLILGHIGTHAVNPALYKHLSYDPVTDFTPVARIASTPVALFASMRAPADTWAGLLVASRAAPKQLTYASFGAGSSSHLYAELLQAYSGVRWLHVPYKGPGPAMQDLMGNQVDLMFDTLASGMPQVQARRIRAIALANAQRSPVAPDLPTFAQVGVKGLEGGPWFALFGPKSMPRPIASKLANALEGILSAPAVAHRLASQGIDAGFLGPAALAAFQHQEIARWAEEIRRFDIKAE